VVLAAQAEELSARVAVLQAGHDIVDVAARWCVRDGFFFDDCVTFFSMRGH
jgi:hypothetical protein